MRAVRALVYRLGLRPRPGSIFHSPSLALMADFADSVEAIRKRVEGAGK